MKGAQFFSVLRKIIREEVRQAVKQELTEALKPRITESTTAKKSVVEKIKPKASTPAPQPKKPTFSGPLASLLNETYESMDGAIMDTESDEWPDLGGRIMTSDDAPMHFPQMQHTQELPQQPNIRASLSGDPTMAFMKDYSSLLKKADAIAQGSR